jgi:iron-sulfur cluster repair protein YtfE (RIC family)
MATITLLDDRTRPKAPKLEGATAQDELPGQHLKMIHRYHLRELFQVRRFLDEIESGASKRAELDDAISSLKMHESMRLFGNLCGQECEMLNAHHSIESQIIFPPLHDRGNDGIKRVVERLMAEHDIIHNLLQDLKFKAAAIQHNPIVENFNSLKETFKDLEITIRSHFQYEETQLEVALGFYGVEI